MVKPALSISTALFAAVAIAASINSSVDAFQSASRPAALAPSAAKRPFAAASTFPAGDGNRRRYTTTSMTSRRSDGAAPSPSSSRSLFRSTSSKARRSLRRARRSLAVLLASLAFFLSSTRVMHAPPAHAASTAAAATSSTLSLTQRLNPFRSRSADEMIDAYVRDRLFADDEYDPVESAYREAFADAGGSSAGGSKDGATSSGAYPALLAETAGNALGRQRSVSSLLSSPTASRGAAGTAAGSSASGGEKNDGITAVMIRASDFLQSRLRVSASVSYYILAGTGLVGICVVPGLVGVLYTGLQRLQIDKSEMKMYGKIADMDATSKKVTDDDDDDDEEE